MITRHTFPGGSRKRLAEAVHRGVEEERHQGRVAGEERALLMRQTLTERQSGAFCQRAPHPTGSRRRSGSRGPSRFRVRCWLGPAHAAGKWGATSARIRGRCYEAMLLRMSTVSLAATTESRAVSAMPETTRVML